MDGASVGESTKSSRIQLLTRQQDSETTGEHRGSQADRFGQKQKQGVEADVGCWILGEATGYKEARPKRRGFWPSTAFLGCCT